MVNQRHALQRKRNISSDDASIGMNSKAITVASTTLTHTSEYMLTLQSNIPAVNGTITSTYNPAITRVDHPRTSSHAELTAITKMRHASADMFMTASSHTAASAPITARAREKLLHFVSHIGMIPFMVWWY